MPSLCLTFRGSDVEDEFPEFDILAGEFESLDRLSRKNGLPELGSVDSSVDGNEENWMLASEGLRAIDGLLKVIPRAGKNAFQHRNSAENAVSELKALRPYIEAAATKGWEFQFSWFD